MFIMGDFPSPSQTFILREMECLHEKGARFKVLAERRVDHPGPGKIIASIQRGTHYLPSKARIASRSLFFFARYPIRAVGLLYWAMRFPHRTAFHRARFLGALMSAISMAPTLSRLEIERLHAHFAGFQTELAMCLSKLLDIPYGVSWHAYGIWKDRNILEHKLLDADVIITCTRYNAAHLRKLVPKRADDIHVVNHGIDVSKLHPVDLRRQKVPLVLAVGRLIPKKGFQYLLEAAAMMEAEGVSFQLIIAGDGPERNALEQKVEELNIQSIGSSSSVKCKTTRC
jgi:colanic acid/amylovoran biosynthesis glycosyltransferase